MSAVAVTTPILVSELLKEDRPKYSGKEATKHINDALKVETEQDRTNTY